MIMDFFIADWVRENPPRIGCGLEWWIRVDAYGLYIMLVTWKTRMKSWGTNQLIRYNLEFSAEISPTVARVWGLLTYASMRIKSVQYTVDICSHT